MKIEIDFLDVVIIRSCQLKCEGCSTFSNHDKINGLEEAENYEEQIAHWSKYILPKRINIFGGEPLMHPRFMNWFRLITKYWPKWPIWVNTNGYLLDKLFPYADELFFKNDFANLCFAITKHTKDEPYGSLVDSNFQKLQAIIKEGMERKHKAKFAWTRVLHWESEYKKFYRLVNTNHPEIESYAFISFCEQFNDNFVPHYQGYGANLKPWHDYHDPQQMQVNHDVCHIKKYVQFYQGNLYKCPPRAVLNHTLDSYDLSNDKDWADYYQQYKPLHPTNNLQEIQDWFSVQKLPEKTCNMCGFMHSHEYHPVAQHFPKKLFKVQVN